MFGQMAGHKFGRLTVLRKVLDPRPGAHWRVRCDCGTEFVVRGNDLRRGRTIMCQRCFKEKKDAESR